MGTKTLRVLCFLLVMLLVASCVTSRPRPIESEVIEKSSLPSTSSSLVVEKKPSPIHQRILTDEGLILYGRQIGIGFYDGPAFLFRGNYNRLRDGLDALTLIKASEKSGAQIRFGPPSEPCLEKNMEFGLYVEKGKEQEFWDTYEEVKKLPSGFPTFLDNFLKMGYRKIDIYILEEYSRGEAKAYVEGNTTNYPNADVRIILVKEDIYKTGQMVDGRVIIRWAFPLPPTKLPTPEIEIEMTQT